MINQSFFEFFLNIPPPENRFLLLNSILKGDMNRPSRGLGSHEDSKDSNEDFKGNAERFLQVGQVLLVRCLSIRRQAYPGPFQGDKGLPRGLHYRFFNYFRCSPQFYGIFHLLRSLPSDGQLYRVVEGFQPSPGGVPEMPL